MRTGGVGTVEAAILSSGEEDLTHRMGLSAVWKASTDKKTENEIRRARRAFRETQVYTIDEQFTQLRGSN